MFLRCSYLFGNLSLDVLINMVLTQKNQCTPLYLFLLLIYLHIHLPLSLPTPLPLPTLPISPTYLPTYIHLPLSPTRPDASK